MEAQLKTTCLHGSHISLGAKMSPFAGFDMPIQYSGIIDEHNAVRNSAGMFDVSHMGEIFVSGKDAFAFVNHIFTNDITGQKDGSVLYGMMLYPHGGTVDDILVYKEFKDNCYLLVVNASNIEKDFDWLVANSKGYDVHIENASEEWGQIAVQGQNSQSVLEKLLGLDCCGSLLFYEFCDTVYDNARLIVSRTGYTGEDGFELYSSPEVICKMWDILLKGGVKPCGLGCRDTLRFETGLPLYGDELSEDISPVMAGLSIFCKPEKPGGFIGSEAIVNQKTNGVARKLVGLELTDKAIPRAGYPVLNAEGVGIGVVTTGYRSISLDKSLCFALVDVAYASLDTRVQVQVRHKAFEATVVKKRFYKTKYKKQ